MVRLIVWRIFEAVLTLFAIATITFFLVRMAPGGPFTTERGVTQEILDSINKHYGLDKPMVVQYANYLKGLARGDMGPSFKYANRSVNELLLEAFPVSMELGAYALIFAMLIGLLSGLLAAYRPNSWMDYTPMSFAMAGICIPSFVLGPLLALVFGVYLGWFNVTGWIYPEDRILPTITLGAIYAAYVARLTRGGMLEVMGQDFIRTARAKGVKESMVVLRHGLRVGVLPVVSFVGPAAAGLITGSFVVEKVFRIPGLGTIIVNAALNRDYFLILGGVLFYGGLLVLLNLIVDMVLLWLDPKMRAKAA